MPWSPHSDVGPDWKGHEPTALSMVLNNNVSSGPFTMTGPWATTLWSCYSPLPHGFPCGQSLFLISRWQFTLSYDSSHHKYNTHYFSYHFPFALMSVWLTSLFHQPLQYFIILALTRYEWLNDGCNISKSTVNPAKMPQRAKSLPQPLKTTNATSCQWAETIGFYSAVRLNLHH